MPEKRMVSLHFTTTPEHLTAIELEAHSAGLTMDQFFTRATALFAGYLSAKSVAISELADPNSPNIDLSLIVRAEDTVTGDAGSAGLRIGDAI
jgi:hypothetical protein